MSKRTIKRKITEPTISTRNSKKNKIIVNNINKSKIEEQIKNLDDLLLHLPVKFSDSISTYYMKYYNTNNKVKFTDDYDTLDDLIDDNKNSNYINLYTINIFQLKQLIWSLDNIKQVKNILKELYDTTNFSTMYITCKLLKNNIDLLETTEIISEKTIIDYYTNPLNENYDTIIDKINKSVKFETDEDNSKYYTIEFIVSFTMKL